jgi:8-amino-3,8-dideoxy-alpha-D-manno-octulosonate transaminase
MARKAALAIDGGSPTIKSARQPGPKVGYNELMGLISLWPVSDEQKREIRVILKKGPEKAPFLFRYYHPSGKSKVAEFEDAFAAKMGTKHALAVNSCTSALVAALVANGIGPGAEVIVPAYTFFASVSVVVVAKAIPVIAEIDDTLTLDPEDVKRKITPQTKAILTVHMVGTPSQMNELKAIAQEHDLALIEDVAQAFGGYYGGKRLGTVGDAGCFSLDWYKLCTAGEGGVLATDNEYLYARAQSYHDTAACWRPQRYARERFEGELFCGENYRMSELQAAVALASLEKVDRKREQRVAMKKRLRAALEALPGATHHRVPDTDGDCATMLALFAPDAAGAKKAVAALKAEGVSAAGIYDREVRDWHIYSYWQQIMQQKTATAEGCPFTCPYYEGQLPEYREDMCPNTLDYLSRVVILNVNEAWDEKYADQVAEATRKVFGVYFA